MGIEEDVYKIMHGIPCEPNIEPCIWENEYGHKPCRENRKETMKQDIEMMLMKQNVEILKHDVDKMKKQIRKLKQEKSKYKVKVKKRK
jgi:predicted RNase H-like nuclease (RuvC/YqgF family)